MFEKIKKDHIENKNQEAHEKCSTEDKPDLKYYSKTISQLPKENNLT